MNCFKNWNRQCWKFKKPALVKAKALLFFRACSAVPKGIEPMFVLSSSCKCKGEDGCGRVMDRITSSKVSGRHS
ncbi:Uncharacterised protein [Chlamydia abortus]|nr:Uncharacterised protein [Chlamydia abortus]